MAELKKLWQDWDGDDFDLTSAPGAFLFGFGKKAGANDDGNDKEAPPPGSVLGNAAKQGGAAVAQADETKAVSPRKEKRAPHAGK